MTGFKLKKEDSAKKNKYLCLKIPESEVFKYKKIFGKNY